MVREIWNIDFLQEPRITWNNRKVDDIAKRLKLEISHNHVNNFPFKLYLWIDSENLSSSRKRRRYATVIWVLGQDGSGFARNKVFQKQRIEADDTSMAARIYYEACSVGKALKELNTHDELKQVLASSRSWFELHIDAYTTHAPNYVDKSSSQAYKRIEKLVNKRQKFPFLEAVLFKPDAIFATGVCDHACRNKF